MKKLIAFVSSAVLLSPLLASAQQLTDINSVASKATNIGNLVIGLTISLAVVWIIINIFRYLVAGGDEGRKKGGMAILFGVIALFAILSIWGLVHILRNSFRTQDQVPDQVRDLGPNSDTFLPRLPNTNGPNTNGGRSGNTPINYRLYNNSHTPNPYNNE